MAQVPMPQLSSFVEAFCSYLKLNCEGLPDWSHDARRVYKTVEWLNGYLREGCTLVEFEALPHRIPIGLHIMGLLKSVKYIGTCVETSDDPVRRHAEALGIALSLMNLDPRFRRDNSFDHLPSRTELKDGSIDVVLMAEVLEHLVWPHDSLQEAKRILKPGGYLIGSVPNSSHIGCVGKVLLGKTPGDPYCDSYLADIGILRHVRFYSPQDICEMLKQNGLKLYKYQYTSYFNQYSGQRGTKVVLKKMLRLIGQLVPFWRDEILFTARKP